MGSLIKPGMSTEQLKDAVDKMAKAYEDQKKVAIDNWEARVDTAIKRYSELPFKQSLKDKFKNKLEAAKAQHRYQYGDPTRFKEGYLEKALGIKP